MAAPCDRLSQVGMTIWAGIDVAKKTHWICAVGGGVKILLSHAVENTQAELDALSAELRALPGLVTVSLDVGGSIATFLPAVLLADDLALIHVPDLAVTAPPTATLAVSTSPIPGTPASPLAWSAPGHPS